MKKFLVFLLTAAMIFSVIGCAQPAAEEAPAVEEAPVEEAVVEEAAPEAAPYVAIVSKGFQHKFWQTVYQGSQDAAAEYGVRSIPANYLIDCATGQIVAVNLRGEEVKAKVAELLQ